MSTIGPSSWVDVPELTLLTWRAIFYRSTEGEDLSAPCPVCGQASLHRWFDLHRPSTKYLNDGWQGAGSQWQWCTNCHSYEHTSGLVPIWWAPTRQVPPAVLGHDPDAIEKLRRLGQAGRGVDLGPPNVIEPGL